jgi:hypothetical protein
MSGASSIGAQQMEWLDALTSNVQITNVTALYSVPVIGQAVSLITKVGEYISTLILMIFLWFPDIWAGNWLWLYFFLCLPVTVGFVVSFVFILRGVHNG